MFGLMASGGMRIGELLKLTSKDVYARNSIIVLSTIVLFLIPENAEIPGPLMERTFFCGFLQVVYIHLSVIGQLEDNYSV